MESGLYHGVRTVSWNQGCIDASDLYHGVTHHPVMFQTESLAMLLSHLILQLVSLQQPQVSYHGEKLTAIELYS